MKTLTLSTVLVAIVASIVTPASAQEDNLAELRNDNGTYTLGAQPEVSFYKEGDVVFRKGYTPNNVVIDGVKYTDQGSVLAEKETSTKDDIGEVVFDGWGMAVIGNVNDK